MIRINKPPAGPRILSHPSGRGQKATQGLRTAYDAGRRTLEFDPGIYGARSVRNALIHAQHHKCCFCESKLTHVSYGNVEHFRPKAGWVQQDNDPLTQPGYYWLAYEWFNLFLSCQVCNQRHKRNHFPLADPTQRARSHHDNLALEQPVFVHPQDDDPEHYVSFRDEVAIDADGSGRGRATIERLGLNRDVLLERRLEALRPIQLLKQTLLMYRHLDSQSPLSPELQARSSEIERFLESLNAPDKEYSSMMKCLLADLR